MKAMNNSRPNGMTKFSGLSSPEELIEDWRNLRQENDKREMNVIWEYEHPEQLKPGFNIVNILYNPEEPDETGHYVLISINPKTKEVEYFNPVSSHTSDNKDKLKDLVDYFDDDVEVNLSGRQSDTSDNCGFHCLTRAYNIYVDNFDDFQTSKSEVEQGGTNVSGILPKNYENSSSKNASVSDKLDDIIKLLRGIYYQSKSKPKGKKGSGVYDVKPQEMNYGELKSEYQKYMSKNMNLDE